MYLVATIGLHSRYVLNWSVSNSMDAQWCKETLEEAINIHGTPENINTDQRSQFTSEISFIVFIQERSNSIYEKKNELSKIFFRTTLEECDVKEYLFKPSGI